MMKWILLAVALLTAVAMGQVPEDFQQRMRACESNTAWETIRWQPDAATALAAAERSNKPLLVVLVVGERGRSDAPRV